MFELTDEMIQKNKEIFLDILEHALISREGANKEGLFKKLESSDFFVAPASTRYHGSYKGGLVDHSLNVYYNMMSIARSKHLLAIHEKVAILDENGNPYPDKFDDKIIEGEIEADSIAIVSLLHDLSKMNYYKIDYHNKKVYCESGSKHDENGKFDWVSIPAYVTIPQEERFIYGSHEETAEFMVRQFVPLTYQESTAILHHHFALSFDSIKDVGIIGNIYNKYSIATLLHVADTLSAYIDERY